MFWLPVAATAQGVGDVEPTPCPVQLPFENELEGQTYDCGIVLVPENHDNPEGRTLELAWMRTKASADSPEMDPVIYLSGGPGASAIHEISAMPTLFQSMQSVRQTRDIIYYDQRGTGRSQVLACGPFNAAIGVIGELYGSSLDLEQLEAQGQGADAQILTMSTCSAGYKASGVDIGQYNSVSSAHDIAMLAQALGYDAYNLYGTSYGTRLALNAMRSTPDRIRAVIVDGTVSPGIPGTAYTTAKVKEHYDTIFRECAADTFCNTTYPEAKLLFIDVLEDISANPVTFDPPLVPNDFMRNRFGVIQSIDAKFFDTFAALNNSASQGGMAGLVPMITSALAMGDTEKLRDILGRGVMPDTQTSARPANADDAMSADDMFLAPALSLLRAIGGSMNAAQGDLSISDNWVKVILSELNNRLEDDVAQAEVIKTFIEFAMVPLAGTDKSALTKFADRYLSEYSAKEANALADAMSRQEVRATMGSIAGIASSMLGLPERDGTAFGVLWSVNCQEDISLTPVQVAKDYIAASPYPGLLSQKIEVYESYHKMCGFFPQNFSAEEMMSHVKSDIPTMVYSGGLDTQTPLSWGKAVYENLTNATFIEWSSEGHIIATHSDDGCAGSIAAAFLNDPSVEPDITCSQSERYDIPFQKLEQIISEKLK